MPFVQIAEAVSLQAINIGHGAGQGLSGRLHGQRPVSRQVKIHAVDRQPLVDAAILATKAFDQADVSDAVGRVSTERQGQRLSVFTPALFQLRTRAGLDITDSILGWWLWGMVTVMMVMLTGCCLRRPMFTDLPVELGADFR